MKRDPARYLAPKATPGAALALGTMNFGKRTDERASLAIAARALDAGLELFDTANVYGDGASERIVGKALRALGRDRVLVATKVGLMRRSGKPEGLSPAAITRAIDESLANLGTDHVDLYWLHAPDPDVPLADTLGAVARLVESGKVRAYGMSNYAAWEILEAAHPDALGGGPRPVAAQQIYNLLVRQLDLEYFRFAARHRVHTTVYNPLAGGLLATATATGARFTKNAMYQRRYATPGMAARAEAYAKLAAEAGRSLLELAYGFVAGHAGVDSILVGPASLEHLEAALAACVPLDPELRAKVDALAVDLDGTDARYAR